MENALNSIKVLDLSTHLPGPCCSLLLKQMGAKVTRVINPNLDFKKGTPDVHSDVFEEYLNDGKDILEFDLKNDDHLIAFYEQVKNTDVILHAFRPASVKRLQVDYETLSKINPKLIYLAISGFPYDDPRVNRAGHEQNFLALSGIYSISKNCSLPQLPMGDILVAWDGAMNITGALFEREKTGKGQFINSSIMKSLDFAQGPFLHEFKKTGHLRSKGEHFFAGKLPSYDVYETKDGRHFSVAPLEPHFWGVFTNTLGLNDLPQPRVEEPQSALDKTRKLIADKFMEKEFKHWCEVFSKVDCCVEPALTWDERKDL